MWLIHWVATVTKSYLCNPLFSCFHCLHNCFPVLHCYMTTCIWVSKSETPVSKQMGIGSDGSQLTAWEWEAGWKAKRPLAGSGCLHVEGCVLRGVRRVQVEEERDLFRILCFLFLNTLSFSSSLDFSSREFARWKVNNLALERRDFFSLPLPLAPEFIRNIRLLGRRPNLQQVTENLIKKYGTHFLLSATLGGKQHHDLTLIGCQIIENSFKTQGV